MRTGGSSPLSILNANAALKRRSSTVVHTFPLSSAIKNADRGLVFTKASGLQLRATILVGEVLLGQPQLQGALLLGQKLYEADAQISSLVLPGDFGLSLQS